MRYMTGSMQDRGYELRRRHLPGTRENKYQEKGRKNLRPPHDLLHDLVGAHHVVVLMLEDVAVVDVLLGWQDSRGQVELLPDAGDLVRVGANGVFPALLVARRLDLGAEQERRGVYGVVGQGRPGLSSRVEGSRVCGAIERSASDHLEVGQVHVDRMRVGADVDKEPVLDRACGRLFVHGVVELAPVDLQLDWIAVRIEELLERDVAVVGGPGITEVRQRSRQAHWDAGWPRRRRNRRRPDPELHKAPQVRRGGADYPLRQRAVLEYKVAAVEAGEVHDDVGPLGGQQQDRLQGDGRVEHASLGADLIEGRSQFEVVEARLRAVQEPEAVHSRFHRKERLHGAVDDYRVAEELRLPLGFI